MTHVKALEAGHSSQGTSELITPGPITKITLTLTMNHFVYCQCQSNFLTVAERMGLLQRQSMIISNSSISGSWRSSFSGPGAWYVKA